jgi:hypothetical protein
MAIDKSRREEIPRDPSYRARAAVAAALAATVVVATALPAQAIPIAGPHQSVTYTFYSNSSKTVQVGWWSYGNCGEPYDIGTHTSWFTIHYTNC